MVGLTFCPRVANRDLSALCQLSLRCLRSGRMTSTVIAAGVAFSPLERASDNLRLTKPRLLSAGQHLSAELVSFFPQELVPLQTQHLSDRARKRYTRFGYEKTEPFPARWE